MTGTAPAFATANRTSSVSWVDHVDQLSKISAPDIDGAVWKRLVPENVAHWLDEIPAWKLPSARMVLKETDALACVSYVFSRFGHEPCAELDWIARDIDGLARIVSGVTQAPRLRLRLDPVSNNACARFHIDFVTARLICTYRGPGTQFGVSEGKAPPEDIESVPAGMPILLKGKCWPQSEAVRLQHRSPPIEGTDTTRLLMVLEGVDASEVGQSPYDEVFEAQSHIIA